MTDLKTTIEIVKEFFDNATDGKMTYAEYCAVYGEGEQSKDNYNVCKQTYIILSKVMSDYDLITIDAMVQKMEYRYFFNQLSVEVQNKVLLETIKTHISDPLSCGYDEGFHKKPIEKQLEYARNIIRDAQYRYNEYGIVIAE